MIEHPNFLGIIVNSLKSFVERVPPSPLENSRIFRLEDGPISSNNRIIDADLERVSGANNAQSNSQEVGE